MPFNPGDLAPLGQINFDEIREFWMGDRSPRTDQFTYRTGNSTETFWIPADITKYRGFIMKALGLDYVQLIGAGGDPSEYHLRRVVPMFHPVNTSMYCTGIVSVNGVAPRGDDDQINEWVGLDTVTPVKWEKYEVVCSFDYPKYRMRGDNQVTKEYQRYVQFKLIPSVQLVSVDKGIILLDAPGVAATDGKPALRAAARREAAGFVLTWFRVPAEWIYDTSEPNFGVGLPFKMLAAQGRVNKNKFFGQPPETVQCFKIDLGDPYVMPLLTELQGENVDPNTGALQNPYFAYDINMYFEFYDPAKKGKPLAPPNPANPNADYLGRHGWNFYLHSDLKYYYGKTSIGEVVYQMADFDKIFTHWTDTANFIDGF